MYYTIFLNFKNRVIERILPADEAGQYFFDISDIAGRENCGISFEKRDGKWHILNDSSVLVTGNDIIEDGSCICIEIKSTVLMGVLFSCELNEETSLFKHFSFQDNMKIGSSRAADIQIKGDYVSREQAVIRRSRDGWVIKNLGKNGIYVNGELVSGERLLNLFDMVWIYGLRFAVTGDGISVQNNSFLVRCPSGASERVYESDTARKHSDSFIETIHDTSSGAAEPVRIYPRSQSPGFQSGHGMSDIMKASVFSGAVLSAVSAVGGDFSFPAAAAVFAGASAAVSGTWIAARKITERKAGKNAREDTEKYLESYAELIEKSMDKYRQSAGFRYMSAQNAVSLYMERKQKLTGRRDEDFLKLRICTGENDFSRFLIAEDGCGPEIKALFEKYRTVSGVPVTADFMEERLITVKGTCEDVCSFAGALAVKISAFHSPADAGMMFFCSGYFSKGLEFVKWLPHVYSEDEKTRYFACTEKSRSVLSDKLSEILELRKYQNQTDGVFPHYIVFCTDEAMLPPDMIKKYTESEAECGVTFVLLKCADVKTLTVSGRKNLKTETETPDLISPENALSYSRLRAADSSSEKYRVPVPEKLSFTEMAQTAGFDFMNIAENYRNGNTEKGIAALAGIGADRKPFFLDIHENAHGPHGLIAGTTGSGKSEFILTFILSLALSYSPEQVAFVLIDYKGGGMSGAFEGLPHTAGILTNLEESAAETDRILISLSSEIKKRQIIFRQYNVSHIDSYMKLFRNGEASEPVPHLVIICDEFAQLKRERPEFISELVSVSRIGRSLGIHLILATQRPSGVVDDEIKSNSSFRICLKVQDRADSMEMTGQPDASEIRNPGRAFIQTGSGCVPELVQTGYSGELYTDEKEELTAVLTGPDASPLVRTAGRKRTGEKTQLKMLTELAEEFCRENGIPAARKLWTRPLGDVITPDEIYGYGEVDFDRGIVFAAGVTDDPENQKMYPSEFNFYETGNIIVAGAAGSGKTVFLHTVLCSLTEHYTPQQFRFSVLDFTGGMTGAMGRLVHCSGFYSSPDETGIKAFFDEVSAETERRKRCFSEVYAADFSEYREACSDIGAWIVCIDGYIYLKEMYPLLDEYFTRLSGEAVKYGIYFIATVKQSSDMRIRTRQNFRTAVVFELSDRTEYADFLGVRPGTELPSVPGRGYLVSERRALVFQGALCCSGKGRERHAALLEFSERINALYAADAEEMQEHFCDFADADELERLAEQSDGRVLVWSGRDDISLSGDIGYTGENGALSLLYELRDEFSERNTARKISGSYSGESLTVVLYSLDDFCSVIYSKGNEDMASVTEKFLSGGSGLGVRFLSPADDSAENRSCRVYSLFEKYSEGGSVC